MHGSADQAPVQRDEQQEFSGHDVRWIRNFATASVCYSEPHERHSKDYERHKNTRYKECLTGEDKTSRKETISQALYVMGAGSTIKEEEGYWQITDRPKEGKLIQSAITECNP